jgi:FtsP/CotA-like multicopper oxidase with cupredoxin domain
VYGDYNFTWGEDETGFVRFPEFVEPEKVYSVDGELAVTLVLDCDRTPLGPYTFNARLWNGTLPSPTLMVKPGDHLSITIVNHLGSQNYSGYDINGLFDYNSTSLHTHGLHVPSTSDNIFLTVDPSQEYTYEYDICDDHYPGSMMYHPHNRKQYSILSDLKIFVV